jgi:predicted site-specific integrase-resolvase
VSTLGDILRDSQRIRQKGYIKPVVLESRKRKFGGDDVEKLMGIVRKRKAVLYARVSPNAQKDDSANRVVSLEENVEECVR